MPTMAAAPGSLDANTAIRKVNDTLQGPVVEILSQFVPELRTLPAGKAYERTLDDIPLLERCFRAFRDQRDKFNYVLVDAERQPVSDDCALLSCGRSLDQVVAMIVRTAAKRYFRRKLNPKATSIPLVQRTREPEKGLVQRVAAMLQGATASKPPERPAIPVRNRADELYEALKAHLLHEWQVGFVPTYADMSPNLARALGAKLLDIRELDELKRIVADPAEAAKLFDLPEHEAEAAEEKPAAASAGSKDDRARLADVLTPDGKRLRVEAFTAPLLRPGVRALLKHPDQTAQMIGALRGVGAMAPKLLVAELGLRVDQLAVILVLSHERVGPDMFARLFGIPGDAKTLMVFTQRARLAGLNQRSSLAECATFVNELFVRFETKA